MLRQAVVSPCAALGAVAEAKLRHRRAVALLGGALQPRARLIDVLSGSGAGQVGVSGAKLAVRMAQVRRRFEERQGQFEVLRDAGARGVQVA